MNGESWTFGPIRYHPFDRSPWRLAAYRAGKDATAVLYLATGERAKQGATNSELSGCLTPVDRPERFGWHGYVFMLVDRLTAATNAFDRDWSAPTPLTRSIYEPSRDPLACPECGEPVWDVATGSKLNKCWNAEGHADGGTLAFDGPFDDRDDDE